MANNYTTFGFSETLPESKADELIYQFRKSASRRRKTAVFISTDYFHTMLTSLGNGPNNTTYDGLKICFGIADAAEGEQYGTYELIFTEVKISDVQGGNLEEALGIVYSSINPDAVQPATPELASRLKHNFQRSRKRRAQLGTFIGLNQLRDIGAELQNGFDGLRIDYGLDKPHGTNQFGKYELVLRCVKFSSLYISINDNSTEPTGLGCPPLSCNA